VGTNNNGATFSYTNLSCIIRVPGIKQLEMFFFLFEKLKARLMAIANAVKDV
jgi:hypothetical protein